MTPIYTPVINFKSNFTWRCYASDKLTNKFQQALADAQSLALGNDNQFIEPIHLLSALFNQQGGSIRPLLTSTGVNMPHNLMKELMMHYLDYQKWEGAGGEVHPSNDLIKHL